jgi:hypothetical protein
VPIYDLDVNELIDFLSRHEISASRKRRGTKDFH